MAFSFWEKKKPEESQPQQEQEGQNKSEKTSGTNQELEDLAKEAAGYHTGVPGVGLQDAPGPEAVPTDPKMIAVFWKMIFATIAKRSGDHWNLSDEELRTLSESSAPLVDKYVPAMLTKYGAEIMFAYTVGTIIVPRWMTSRANGKEKGHIDNPGTAGSGQDDATKGAA